MDVEHHKLAAIMFTDIVGYAATVGADEERALRLRELHTSLVQRAVIACRGEFVSEIGDETFTIFPSTMAAVRAALEVQRSLANSDELAIRVGIDVGDVLHTGGRLVGDSINVAARILHLAAPGQICLSERAYDDVRNKPGLHARSLGRRTLRNLDRAVTVFIIGSAPSPGRARRRAGLGRAAAVLLVVLGLALAVPYRHAAVGLLLRSGWVPAEIPYEKEIRFVTAADGVRIAYATAGSGPPVVIVRGWFTHLKLGVNGWVRDLMSRHRVVFYDCRGMGLSDRNVADYSLDARIGDLKAVVQSLGLERFALFGDSGGGPVAIAFAAEHPDAVTRLLLYGTYAHVDDDLFRRWTLVEAAIRLGWDLERGPFRQIFESVFFPDAGSLMVTAVAALSTVASDPADALQFILQGRTFDVRPQARRIRAPTMVVHRRGDQMVPLGIGREIASIVPDARLVVLDGRNHLFLPGDPQRGAFVEVAAGFLAGGDASARE